MNIETPQWLIDMPKSDLHRHIGGSIRIDTILELADNYSIKLPAKDAEELKKKIVHKKRKNKTLITYLDAIAICESVLVKPEAFERVAYEICEDAKSEKINILELRFGPTNYANGHQNLYEIMEATISGIEKGLLKHHIAYTGKKPVVLSEISVIFLRENMPDRQTIANTSYREKVEY